MQYNKKYLIYFIEVQKITLKIICVLINKIEMPKKFTK